MTKERNWREAKPKWLVEAAEAELQKVGKIAALRWPMEKRPTPASFHFGDYDRLHGDFIPGTYFFVRGGSDSFSLPRVESVSISRENGYRFIFEMNGRKVSYVVRGPLYLTPRDAALAHLWDTCDAAASRIQKAMELVREVSDDDV